MYSAVFFGWPVTTISPSRCTSTPTCSMDVASSTSVGDDDRPAAVRPGQICVAVLPEFVHRRGRVERRVEGLLQLGEALGDPAARHSPGQFVHDRPSPPRAHLTAAAAGREMSSSTSRRIPASSRVEVK